MLIRPGWYLEAAVDVDGVSRKIAMVDGNCDFNLGDPAKLTTAQNNGNPIWTLQGGDYFLVTAGGLVSNLQSAASAPAPFGPVLYLNAKPYKVLRFRAGQDPPTGAVERAARGIDPDAAWGASQRIALGWENTPGNWQLLQVEAKDGKAMVPPGNFRLYSCVLKAARSANETIILHGTKRAPDATIAAKAGETSQLKVGAPLASTITCARTTTAAPISAGLGSIFSSSAANQPVDELIQATIIGAGGEQYSSFSVEQKGRASQPPKPKLVILDANGKQLQSADMEYG